MTDQLAQEERRKYQKMWSMHSYRTYSPGLSLAPDAHISLEMKAGQSIIDYGCGEGKAVDWFRSWGLITIGVDIVSLRSDLIEACLWDLPKGLGPTDYGFCADVMEHIPPGRVDDVFASIVERTTKGVFFSIATVECKQGKRYDETLHLTVEPIGWWLEKIAKHFDSYDYKRGDQPWRWLVIARCSG